MSLGIAGAAGPSWLSALPQDSRVTPVDADLVVFNARVYTYNSREEKMKGSITPGKLANFVVLADDSHAVSGDKTKDIQIVRTVVGRTAVYQA